jgi:hypothetical protein
MVATDQPADHPPADPPVVFNRRTHNQRDIDYFIEKEAKDAAERAALKAKENADRTRVHTAQHVVALEADTEEGYRSTSVAIDGLHNLLRDATAKIRALEIEIAELKLAQVNGQISKRQAVTDLPPLPLRPRVN